MPRSPVLSALVGFSLFGAFSACSTPEPEVDQELASQLISSCNGDVVQVLTGAHGLMLVFAPCGVNDVRSQTWGPDGIQLYFDLVDGGYLLDGDRHLLRDVDTPVPLTNGVWLGPDHVSFVLPPDDTHPSQGVAVLNIRRKKISRVDTHLREPRHLTRGDSVNALYVTALDEAGQRRPWRVDTGTGVAERILPWLEEPVDSLTWEPNAGMVGWSAGGTAHVAHADGSGRMDFPDATRAVVHPSGRYVALERTGLPVAAEGGTGALPPAVQGATFHPAPTDTTLEAMPCLDLWVAATGVRYRILGFQGDDFEWYRAKDFWASFRLLGVNGREINRNVALVDLSERLARLEKGESPVDLEQGTTAVPLPASLLPTKPAAASPATAPATTPPR